MRTSFVSFFTIPFTHFSKENFMRSTVQKVKKITISLPTEILSKAFEKYSRNYKTKKLQKILK